MVLRRSEGSSRSQKWMKGGCSNLNESSNTAYMEVL